MADGNQGNQPTGMQWWSPPKLPCYSGEPADGPAEDFIAEANRLLAAYNNIPAPAAIELIIRHLQGKARREVLSQEGLNTPKKVLEALKKTFGDSRPLTALMTAFHGKHQLPGQSVLEYAHVIKSLEGQANAKKDNSISGDMLRDQFIEGLSSTQLKRELRRLVREREDTTFQSIREEALRWTREEDDPMEALPAAIPAVFQQHVSQSPQEVAELERKLMALTKRVEDVQTSVSVLLERFPPTSLAAEPFQRKQTPNVRCFNCNKQGHIARNCSDRRRQGQNRAEQRSGN